MVNRNRTALQCSAPVVVRERYPAQGIPGVAGQERAKEMKFVKANFTMPADLKEKLVSLVGPRKRSAFIASAIREKLERIENERLRRRLIEGYRVLGEDSEEERETWEAAALETRDECAS